MRIPVVLMLLTVLLLPADLQGLAAQLRTGAETAQAAVTNLLERDDELKVAQVTTKLALGSTVAQVR